MIEWVMLDYLFPITLEVVKSRFNGNIKVVKFQNKISVWVGGYEQSGALVEKVFSCIGLQEYRDVLILGLGCGSIVKYLPNSKITGVEIDPEMIKIGKKYFNYQNTKIIIGDATKLNFKNKFDLIIVDLYKSGVADIFIPDPKLLKRNGTVIFNQLDFNKTDILSHLDKNKFYEIKKIRKFEYNKLIFCSRK
jgi:precorrin-6B methylase 2